MTLWSRIHKRPMVMMWTDRLSFLSISATAYELPVVSVGQPVEAEVGRI